MSRKKHKKKKPGRFDIIEEVTAPEEEISKSALKREMTALQELGVAIVKLSGGQFATIPLEGQLQEAILTARRLKSREGLRRQMQFIGKLMRSIDITGIETAYQQLLDGKRNKAKAFHAMEVLRDQLLEDGVSKIEEIIGLYPDADRQHLRQLVMQAAKEKSNNKPPAASRKLFKYLREVSGE
jgi:ribosome-associated protein